MEHDIEDDTTVEITPKGRALVAEVLETGQVPDAMLNISVLDFFLLFNVATGCKVPLPKNLQGRKDLAEMPLQETPSVIEQLRKALVAWHEAECTNTHER